jgi:hypothetical protein
VLHSSVCRVTYREHLIKYTGQSARRLGCRIDDRGIGFRFLAGAIKPYFLHSVHTGSVVYPESYPVGTEVLSLAVKQMGRKAITHLHVVPKLRMRGAIPQFPKHVYGVVLN